jgi:hypothetical protein
MQSFPLTMIQILLSELHKELFSEIDFRFSKVLFQIKTVEVSNPK